MEGIIDLYELSEDERILIIGDMAMTSEKPVGFLTDMIPGKEARYCDKLIALFPELIITGRKPNHPVPEVVTVIVSRRAQPFVPQSTASFRYESDDD